MLTPRFEVQELNASGHWVNEWERTFSTYGEAKAELEEYLKDGAEAIAEGFLIDMQPPEYFRVAPVNTW